MNEVGYYGDDPRGQNYWDDLADEREREFGDGPMRIEQGDPDHNPAFDEPEEVWGAEQPDQDDGVSIDCPACGYELDAFGVCRNEACVASPDRHPDAPGLYDDELGPDSYDWRK